MYKERISNCAQRIAQALETRGMKQAELVKLAHVPKSSLSLYLSGEYEPKQDRIYKMAQVLDVSEAWLMGFDVPMEREKKTPDKLVLTEGEELLVQLFRRLPDSAQTMYLELLKQTLAPKK